MKLVAIGEQEAYLVSGEKAGELFQEWEQLCRQVAKHNIDLFNEIYQKTFNLPDGLSPQEEDAIIVERFGEAPAENPEFLSLLVNRNHLFFKDKLKTTPAMFREMARRYECTLEKVTTVSI